MSVTKLADYSHPSHSIMLALFVAVQVMGSVATVAPSTKPAFHSSLPLVKSSLGQSKVLSVLDLRGGASLGPITPSVGVKIWMLSCVFYVIRLCGFDPTCPDPTQYYFGTAATKVSKGLYQWESLFLAAVPAVVAYLGLDPVEACKIACFEWAATLVLYFWQYSQGILVKTEAPAISAVSMLLNAYLAFA